MSETTYRREQEERRVIFVVGGTGNVRRHVMPALVEKGEAVRVLTRGSERARWLVGEGAEVVGGDLDGLSTLGAPFPE